MASFYDLFKNPDLEEEKAAFDYAQRLTPAERSVMDERLFERQGVKGIERMGRAALGMPPALEAQREQAAQELRALAQKMRPGTAEFYEAAIAILQKYNMPSEAADMEKQRLALETGKAELSPVLKLTRARDVLTKRPDADTPQVKAAIAAIDREIAKAGTTQAGGSDPEFVKLLNEYEAAIDAGKFDRAEQIKKALDAWVASKARTPGEMTEYQRQMLEIAKKREKREGEKNDRKVKTEDEAAVRSLQGMVRLIDNQIQSATALVGHPGLAWITGARAGTKLGSTVSSFLRGAASDAQALMDNVLAQVFIQALQDLKATSRTSASGLGQLTEKEGDKIQNAKVAIRPQQQTEQFKRTLTEYLRILAEARAVSAGELGRAKADVPAAPPPLQTSTPVSDLAPSAKPRPTPEPAEAPKPKGKWSAKRVG